MTKLQAQRDARERAQRIRAARITIRLQDDSNKVMRWTIKRVPRAVNCTLGQKTRIVAGWQFTDHEGYTRFAEGNWRDLVAMFHATAQNYGLQLLSELS